MTHHSRVTHRYSFWIYIVFTDINLVDITIVSPLPSSSLLWNQNRIYFCPDCGLKKVGAKEIVNHCRCQPTKKIHIKWTSPSVLKPIDKWSIIIFISKISLLIPSTNLWLSIGSTPPPWKKKYIKINPCFPEQSRAPIIFFSTDRSTDSLPFLADIATGGEIVKAIISSIFGAVIPQFK